VQTYNFDIILS